MTEEQKIQYKALYFKVHFMNIVEDLQTIDQKNPLISYYLGFVGLANTKQIVIDQKVAEWQRDLNELSTFVDTAFQKDCSQENSQRIRKLMNSSPSLLENHPRKQSREDKFFIS